MKSKPEGGLTLAEVKELLLKYRRQNSAQFKYRGYSQELRDQAVLAAKLAKEDGKSWGESAAALGISSFSLSTWRGKGTKKVKTKKGKAGFAKVSVVPEAPFSDIYLELPGGIRVRGLTKSALMELLTQLLAK